jgi:hypothetical protein
MYDANEGLNKFHGAPTKVTLTHSYTEHFLLIYIQLLLILMSFLILTFFIHNLN